VGKGEAAERTKPAAGGRTRDAELAHAAGHAENEYNNRCDQLAVAESQKYK